MGCKDNPSGHPDGLARWVGLVRQRPESHSGLKTVSLSSSSALQSAKHASDPDFGKINVSCIIGGDVVVFRKDKRHFSKKELYTVLPMEVTQWQISGTTRVTIVIEKLVRLVLLSLGMIKMWLLFFGFMNV